MHLVDLAGSERVSKTQILGTVLSEAKHINLSLHFLEQVIASLQVCTCLVTVQCFIASLWHDDRLFTFLGKQPLQAPPSRDAGTHACTSQSFLPFKHTFAITPVTVVTGLFPKGVCSAAASSVKAQHSCPFKYKGKLACRRGVGPRGGCTSPTATACSPQRCGTAWVETAGDWRARDIPRYASYKMHSGMDCAKKPGFCTS